MFDANRILGQLLGSPAAAGFAGGLAGGMLTGKSGRKMAKKTLQYGSIAAIGALAYTAWQHHRQQQVGQAAAPAAPAAPAGGAHAGFAAAPVQERFVPPAADQQANNRLGLTLVRAMIAAANADGTLDGSELQAILDRVESLQLADEDKAVLMGELRKPVGIDALVAAADSPEVATEIYVAAYLAITADTAGEQAWLRELAGRLRLPEGVVQSVHAQAAAAGA